MEYEIVELQEKKAAGLRARTNNFSPDMGMVIGGLWQQFYQDGIYSRLPGKVTGKSLGVYSGYEADEKADYDFSVACAGRYAKFIVRGNVQTAVGEFWQELWKMELKRTFVCDFEEYQDSEMDQAEIHVYIGVK